MRILLSRVLRGVSESGPTEDDEGGKCLRRSLEAFQEEGKYDMDTLSNFCNATWDSVYCWPYTPAGTTLMRPCSEVMQDSPDIEPSHISLITGNAVRICGENGTWLWGNWTNYNECLESLEQTPSPNSLHSVGVVDAVRWILFLGSIVSFISLAISLFVFYHFKCLRCDRVTVHIHLMVSLTLRFFLLILMTEPFIFEREDNYRNVEWVCKVVTSLLMYATVASIHWMFIQGHYLHGRLTTNIFDRGTPFKVYYTIGWVIPLIIVLAWAVVMEFNLPLNCWKNYSKHHYIWILVGPMTLALLVNLLFLINIMRILLTKIQRANTSSDAAQFRRAVKATAILFPLLGINNLLFAYNPGGGYENVYMVANTILQSTQGVFVSFLYCFLSQEVREAVRREYRRFRVRRSANYSRRQSRRSTTNTSIIFLTPKASCIQIGEGKGIREQLNPTPNSLNFQQDTSLTTLIPMDKGSRTGSL